MNPEAVEELARAEEQEATNQCYELLRRATHISEDDGLEIADDLDEDDEGIYREVYGVAVQDEQTKIFTDLLSLAWSFSTMSIKQRITNIPTLVYKITNLIHVIQAEIKQLADLANEFMVIIEIFVVAVKELQHHVGLLIPKMESVQSQVKVLQDIMWPGEGINESVALNEEDKLDANTALTVIVKKIDDFREINRNAMQQANDVAERSRTLREKLTVKKCTAQNRIALYESLTFPLVGAAGTLSTFLGTELVVSELAIAGIVVSPFAAAVSAFVVGGTASLAIVAFLRHLLTRKEYKTLQFVNELLSELQNLCDNNTKFLESIRRTDRNMHAINEHLEILGLCLTSERQRRINSTICSRADAYLQQAKISLEQISKIDLEFLLNNSAAESTALTILGNT